VRAPRKILFSRGLKADAYSLVVGPADAGVHVPDREDCLVGSE